MVDEVRRNFNPITSSLIIGFAYGVYRVVGVGAQGVMNITSYYAGLELAKRINVKAVFDDPEEYIKALNDALGLAEEIRTSVEGDKLKVVVVKCNVCPKRIGGYNIEGRACPLPGLLIGFIHGVCGVKVEPRKVVRKVQWGVGEHCEFVLPLSS